MDGIRPARFRGRAELALTEHGLAQVDALARRIAAGWKPAAVYTSPMQRCGEVRVQRINDTSHLDRA